MTRRYLLISLCFYAGSVFSYECEPPKGAPGDWRKEISSAQHAKYMLSMELTQSLEATVGCVAENLLENAMKSEGASGDADVTSSFEKQSESAKTESDIIVVASGSEQDKRAARKSDNQIETNLESGDGIEPILREAILAENDPRKKAILRERYRQLVKKEPP